MIVGGAVLATGGGTLLWSGRAQQVGKLSPPARVAVGLAGLFLGYHLIAWAIPMAPMLQVPKERWWVVVGAAVAAAGLSVLTDWLQNRGDSAENG